MTPSKYARLLAQYIWFCIWAHTKRAKNPRQAQRFHDKFTPFAIHPIWCALTLLMDAKVPAEIRYDGALALILHDLIEDTTEKLPKFVSSRVGGLVRDMTFASSEEEWREVWSRPQVVLLLKVYDKVNTFLDADTWMTPRRREQHVEHLRNLMAVVEPVYGDLKIFRLARAVM